MNRAPAILDELLPSFEATVVRETAVGAPPDVTYAAIADTNLLDPMTGMPRVAEDPGVEMVVGSVGRSWERDYGHRDHRRFRRYWRLIRPGVRPVMGRALALIREEAERRAAATGLSDRTCQVVIP